MNAAKALWASIQGDPRTMRILHGWLTIVWLLVGIVTSVYAFFQPDSPWLVPVLVLVSFYANTAGHWSSWQAARIEEKQDQAAEENAG